MLIWYIYIIYIILHFLYILFYSILFVQDPSMVASTGLRCYKYSLSLVIILLMQGPTDWFPVPSLQSSTVCSCECSSPAQPRYCDYNPVDIPMWTSLHSNPADTITSLRILWTSLHLWIFGYSCGQVFILLYQYLFSFLAGMFLMAE